MGAIRRLLDRQLRKHFGEDPVLSDAVQDFVATVEEAYLHFEADYSLLERSLELSSQELIQANTEMRVIIQAFPDFFLWLTPEGTITGCRARDSADLPAAVDALIGKRLQDLELTGAGDDFQAALERLARGEPMASVEYSLGPHNSEQFFEARLLPLRPGQVIAIVRNITDRRRVELEREHSMSLLQATFDSTADGILVLDLNGQVVSCNQRFFEMWRVPDRLRSEHTRPEMLMFVATLLKTPVALCKGVEPGRSSEAEPEFLELLDGRIVEQQSRPQLIGGSVVGRVWGLQDVTEREAAAQRILESERRYRLLFDANPQPMWVFDTETLAFLAVNEAAIDHYGYSRDEFREMSIADIRPAEDRPALLRRIAELESVQSEPREWRHLKRDGTLITVAVRSHRIEFVGRPAALALLTDVTSQRQLELQLRQTQKLEAVGQLAGGVAHDFNNLLTVISGYGQILSTKLAPRDELRGYCDEVLKAADRGASLTGQLLAFSRQQILALKPTDLREIVVDVQRMLERLIGEDIVLEMTQASDLRLIKADRGQVEQVILNLVVNARDAMPEGGRLSITTANRCFTESSGTDGNPTEPGEYVVLEVRDTGSGMPPEIQSRIFEPFYTTKEQGRGTGLGLSTVYGIVRQMGGSIRVESLVGQGTCFRLCLPVCEEPPEPELLPTITPSRRAVKETVPVVEDDPTVRALVRKLLLDHGYVVLEATDGASAIELARDHPGPVDLLLTDVIMPGLSGRETADRLLSGRPQTRVLFMSGYTDDQVLRHGIYESGVAFLQKPFTREELMAKLLLCLESEPRQRAA
jgi:two-component system, cell cycle sensor histidine kinase and response regulator CckA